MAMKPETVNDILTITQNLHRQLADNLANSANKAPEQSKQLLADMAEYEDDLARTLEIFQKEADLGPLNTWFYLYTDRHSIVERDLSQVPFADMDEEEIADELATLHHQFIDLYTHLHGRAEADSPRQLLSQLLDMETSKGHTIIFESGRSAGHYHRASSNPPSPDPRRS